MARIELKGKITAVAPVQEVGEKKTLIQRVLFETPPYRDEYGDEKGETQHWQLDVLGDQIAKLGIANNAIGRNAKLTVYVDSRKVILEPGTKNEKTIYPVSLKIGKVEFAEVKQTA